MVRHCSVRGCQPDRFNFRISQFQFPKIPEQKEKWIKFVQLGRGSSWQPKYWHLICSRHFENSCFDKASIQRFKTSSNSRLVMLENAAPTLHGYLLGQGPVRVLDINKVKVTEAGNVTETNREGVEDYEDSWRDESFSLQQARKDFLKQMQERMKNPPQKLPSSPQKGPPDVSLPVSELNDLLTCGLCKGYIISATTITECLHSFCRSCLINHVKGSVLCPTCSTVIHPSNPFSNMRADWTMQDIVFKIFPHVEKEEKLREAEFYRSRGLPYPPKEAEPVPETIPEKRPRPLENCPSWVSIELKNVGVMPGTPTDGSLKTLPKCFVRIPSYTTLAHVKLFVEAKLNVHREAQVFLFIENYVLHSSLTVEDIWNIFYAEEEEGIYPIQYGVVPHPYELFVKSASKSKHKYHRKVKHWPEKPQYKLYLKRQQRGRPAKRGRRPGGPGRPSLKRAAADSDDSPDKKIKINGTDSNDYDNETMDSRNDLTVKKRGSSATITSNECLDDEEIDSLQETVADEEALASFLDEELAHCDLGSSRADTPTLCQLDSRMATPTLDSNLPIDELSSPADMFEDDDLASIAQLF